MKKVTLRLIVTVSYESEDDSPIDVKQLVRNLEDIPQSAASDGLMSQGTSNALVSEWHAKVETV